MKNPTQPNFKTEWYPAFIVALSILSSFLFRVSFQNLVYFWPIMIAAVYAMFLFFPYFRINHEESAALKEQWHKAKELSLSFLFTLQIVGGVYLSGKNLTLIWALPILFILLLLSLVPTVMKVLKYRKTNPITYRWGHKYGK